MKGVGEGCVDTHVCNSSLSMTLPTLTLVCLYVVRVRVGVKGMLRKGGGE